MQIKATLAQPRNDYEMIFSTSVSLVTVLQVMEVIAYVINHFDVFVFRLYCPL